MAACVSTLNGVLVKGLQFNIVQDFCLRRTLQ